MADIDPIVSRYFEKIGAKGGSSKSLKKAEASRLNGLKRKKAGVEAVVPVNATNNRSSGGK